MDQGNMAGDHLGVLHLGEAVGAQGLSAQAAGITHLTVYARSESTGPLQPAYVVDGARGRLYVRAFSETWQSEAESLEAALNQEPARRDD